MIKLIESVESMLKEHPVLSIIIAFIFIIVVAGLVLNIVTDKSFLSAVALCLITVFLSVSILVLTLFVSAGAMFVVVKIFDELRK